MLTKEGYRNRFWRGYPQLRQLLEPKDGSIPEGVNLLRLLDDDEPRISTDHGPLGRLADVLAIARILASRGSEVQDAMRVDTSAAEGIPQEVGQLLAELESAIHDFRRALDALSHACGREIEVTRTVVRDIRELGTRLRPER
jgi:hypothetical protein